MEYRYSERIDPSTYNRDDELCRGIDLRRHKDLLGELRGALRCQYDWSRLVSPLQHFKGALGDPFSFIRVTIPETLPERLEIVSYADEFAFLYDDTVVEDVDQNLEAEDRSRILDDFSRDKSTRPDLDGTSKGAARTARGLKQIQTQIFREMMAIDKAKTLNLIDLWRQYMKATARRKRSEPFTTLDEYLPYRKTETAELFWYGLMIFGMNLDIREHEMDLLKQLGGPAWAAVGLTNDIFSWDKERDAAAKAGASHVINAIWVLMREHSIGEAEAHVLCREKIKELVAEARRIAEQTKRNPELSRGLGAFTEAMLYTISGNLVWSMYCPRYHPELAKEDLMLP